MELEPIAIIGIGCRFPNAKNPQAFWELIRDGIDAISEVPESRWDVNSFYDPDGSKVGKTNTRWGGFLEDIDYFDPQFFGIAPKEAVTMDPQQRLLLEVAWETLEDAGQIPEDLRGSNTGVFVGIGTHDYSIMMWQQPVSEPYATTGTGNCIAANRVSYVFDFKGPSIAVDTACSSSLVAVHLACQSIWTGESSQALAGGVNMLLLPTIMVGFSKGGFMSSDGRCKSFDRSADGYVRGEGAGLVLLKSLSQAQADGDDIYGTILSSAVNQDGCSNGLAAPNLEAQEAVLREAYRRGGIDPSLVSYLEAHGTGTKIGDSTEIGALEAVLGANRQPENNFLVGSVKTNIGHTETAAGIAGIIKVALALKHQQIPPSLHFNHPNPKIAAESNLQVVTKLTPWTEDRPIVAGVNSFGFGGTNAHIVMGDWQVEEQSDEENLSLPLQLLTLSAKSKSALQELAQDYQNLIQSDISLKDICAATHQKRSHFNHRLTCISQSTPQLKQQLDALISGAETAGVTVGCVKNQPAKICWMFTGQGSQYSGMGQQLYQTQPVFRQALDRCAAILEPYLDIPLLTIIAGANPISLIDQTIYTQPAIFSLEYALAQLWLAWGVKPDYVMGHSIGEYVAACIAGVFSLEDGLKLVANRGKLMEELPSSGGMLAISAGKEQVKELITSYNQGIELAALNNSQSTVIAGKKADLIQIKEKLDQLQIESTFLLVSHAFHSPLMQPMLADFRSVAEQVTYNLPQIPLISNVTAQLATSEITRPDYWVDHIIKPVEFARSFQFLLQQGIEVFLEVGAKPILSSLGKTILATETNYSPLLLPSLSARQSDWSVILNSIAQLYHQGIKIDWQTLDRDNFNAAIKLPHYPFQRQRYWWDKAKFWTQNNFKNQQQFHPLLGDLLTLAESLKVRFQAQINVDTTEYLSDHCLESQVVFPATAYLETILAAGKQLYQTNNLRLEQFTIKQPLLLDDKITTLQTVINQSDNSDRLQIFSKIALDPDFTLHCKGILQTNNLESAHFIEIETGGTQQKSTAEINNYYQRLKKLGLNYGDNFQGIKKLWQGEQLAVGYIEIPENITDHQDLLHPALLDSCFQLIGTTIESPSGVYLPVSIESLQLYKPASNSVWAEVKIEPSNNPQMITANLSLADEQGEAIAVIKNLSLQYLSLSSLSKLVNVSDNQDRDVSQNLYQITWEEQKLDTEHSHELPENILIYGDNCQLTLELEQKLTGERTILFLGQEYQQIQDRQYQIEPTKLADFQHLWQQINRNDAKKWGIIYVQDADLLTPYSSIPLERLAGILHLLQLIPPQQISQLVTVTNQTQIKTNRISSGIWGMMRAINLEYPNLKCLCLDLEDVDTSNNVSTIIREITHCDRETQVSYHSDRRYVPRLAPKNNVLDRPFQLQLSDYGTLDNLTLAPLQRRSLQPDEIEIEVQASGVNFRDVLNALGVLKEYLQAMGFTDSTQVPFGGECAGTVVGVGAAVSNFQVGDAVIAAQAVGSLSSHVIVNAKFAIAKPKHLNYGEAATIPTTFLTAYYGLHHLAKIKPGDRVLIHAAAGGVGQAAVQLAQHVGAEVFATASVGKWDFLKASGIKHVMNSRTLDFAEEVMELTEGRGVDLVLNSLNGDFIAKNLDILASQGRFVEIGKVGIWDEKQVREKRDDVSYFPFDLLEVSQQDPDLIAELLAQLNLKFSDRTLQPLPYKAFPIQSADNAFRYMAQAKHLGKVVITLPANNRVVKTDGAYLITGGLGALGLKIAAWLVAEGASKLILLGRNQPTKYAQQEINKLEQQGITVDVVRADITDYDALKNIISSQVRGIIHAAGILDDGLLNTLSWERFQAVLQPKIMGAWNLHLATQKLDLDWFVCFSSVVSVFGAVGQSNYAAANACLDNLMSYRRNLGLPGLSINWSIWDEVGMATHLTAPQQQRLTQQGLTPIALQQGLKVLKQLLQQQATQTVVFPVDWPTFLTQQPPNPFFAKLQPQIAAPQPKTSSLIQQLATTSENQRHLVLQEYIRAEVAKVLGFPDAEDIDTQEKFADLGMDSLMAVEFKNNLKANFGNAISLTAAFDYPTVELLTDYIAEELVSKNVLAEIKGKQPHHLTPKIATAKSREQPQEPAPPITRAKIDVKPEFTQFKLNPEYLNLQQDLQRVEKLGNPFFSLHQGIAQDTIVTGDRQLINYSGYNYIGMSGDPTIIEAAQKAIAEYGTSVSASRLLSGERPLHLELEREIANFIGTEDAIVYVGGHATNVSTIGHLFNERDLIICDALSHNSIKEGCKLSGATIIDFPHNDNIALEAILERERKHYQKVLIAVEGIYSTDGDLAPLSQIVELKHYYQTFLLVDEAHSIGVLGRSGGGVREQFDLQPTDVDLWMGTLSKSFASCGGYIAGSQELIQYLKYTAPGFVFSVGMSPANTAAALASIKLLKSEPERAIQLQSRAKFCLDLAQSKNFNTGSSHNSPIVPIIVGEPHKAVRLSQLLATSGINVNPMVYPSVPYDAARLRFFITCLHSETQIQSTMELLEQAISSIL